MIFISKYRYRISSLQPLCYGFNCQHPNDRDRPYYLNNLHDWEYSDPAEIAREKPMLSLNSMLVGLFSNEKSGKLFNPKALIIQLETTIRFAWIGLDENQTKRCIERRSHSRDEWRLAKWEQYVKRKSQGPIYKSSF